MVSFLLNVRPLFSGIFVGLNSLSSLLVTFPSSELAKAVISLLSEAYATPSAVPCAMHSSGEPPSQNGQGLTSLDC